MSTPKPDDERLAAIREQVSRSRAAQGLPPTIEDPVVLGRVADLFRLARPAREAS